MVNPPSTQSELASATDAAGSDESFDMEAMIADFLADANISSLELPISLTAEQRKHARKLADQHPELKCESFGFGADRRLHLFKKSTAKHNKISPKPHNGGTSSVSVKNTFIDDWIAVEGGDEAFEPIVFRSTPVQLSGNTLLDSVGNEHKLELTPIAEGLSCHDVEQCVDALTSSLDNSFTNSSEISALQAATHPELPPSPEDLQVRHGFIHFKNLPVSERFIQTVPHNMFGNSLWEEASAANQAKADIGMTSGPPVIDTSACAGISDASALPTYISDFVPGTEVIIEGLVKLPTFNGLKGVVQSLNEETGRYSILLNSPTPCGKWWAKVKSDNLRSVVPPPPPTSPMFVHRTAFTLPPTPTWEEGINKDATPLSLTALV